jgi:hypothetical protein
MRIQFTSGEEIPQIVPSAVSFTPFGLYLSIPGTKRLVPWTQVREISSDQDDIYRLLREAEPAS